MQVTVKNLSFSLKGRKLIDNININLNSGALVGILGPNGAGKTTLLKNICNIYRPTGGDVRIDGRDVNSFSPSGLSKKFCYLSQNVNFNFPFKVSEIVLMGRYPYLKRMQNEGIRDYEIAKKSLAMVDMLDFFDRDILTLSGGEQQRVSLSRIIAQDTEFLFLDEPLSNLDINHQLSVIRLLKSLCEKGKAVVVVLHDLRLAHRYCDQIIVLNHGKVVKQGNPSVVLSENLISSVFKVRSAVVKDSAGEDSIDIFAPVEPY